MSKINVKWQFDKDEDHIISAVDENENVICAYGVFTRADMDDYAVMRITPTDKDDENENQITYDIIYRGEKAACIEVFGDMLEVFIGIRCISKIDGFFSE